MKTFILFSLLISSLPVFAQRQLSQAGVANLSAGSTSSGSDAASALCVIECGISPSVNIAFGNSTVPVTKAVCDSRFQDRINSLPGILCGEGPGPYVVGCSVTWGNQGQAGSEKVISCKKAPVTPVKDINIRANAIKAL